MTIASRKPITKMLRAWGDGDRAALDEMMPLIYDELRRLARSHLRRERPDHTLQTTALVNEAYLKLVDQRNADWHNRTQFFAVAAQLMRRILVDYARGHRASKRGGDYRKITLDETIIAVEENDASLLAVDEALNALAAIDPQQSRIVELRVFGGLTVEEVAQALGVSPSTVKREWSMAKAWLRQRIKHSDG